MSPDRANFVSAFSLFENAAKDGGPCLAVCAGSLKDAYYISRRDLSENQRRNWIRRFIETFEVLPVDSATCGIAVDSSEPDFEDGIIRACAEQWNADCIVSRDAKAFLDSSVPKITGDMLVGNVENAPLER
ncbi:PIN domain-containing protein [Bifidobacterium sp. ESL0763]|nr:PIN domain-containing protein [Bifidobacterium sp. ESL0763]MDF7663544.1 PIN domain-containing protein [Bifidobacterium sp. ESL0763]